MTRTEDIMTYLVRVALWGVDTPNTGKIDFTTMTDAEWEELHADVSRLGIAAIAFDAFTALGTPLPRREKMRYISTVDKIETDYASKLKAAVVLAEIYRQNGIRMMILKGLGLSTLYPIPNHRPCSDVDIYLFGKQQEADKLLHEKYNIKIDESHHHHTVFYINQTMIENHYDFMEAHSYRSNSRRNAYLNAFAEEEALPIDLRGHELYIPSPNLNALFLLSHSGAHFAAGEIAIRHVIDWALFLKNFHDKVNWTKIIAIADELGFRPFLDCINSLAVDYIGLNPNCVPTTMEDKTLVARAWKDVLTYNITPISKNPIKGWIYRFIRRFRNTWKQKMVYNDSLFISFILSALSHFIKPKYWQKSNMNR